MISHSIYIKGLSNFRETLFKTAKRFPGVSLCCLVVTLGVVFINYSRPDPATRQFAERILMTAALGVPLCFTLRIFSESNPGSSSLSMEWWSLPLLALAYWKIPNTGFFGGESVQFRWWLTFAGLHFATAAVAFVRKGLENAFWQLNRRLFFQFFSAFLHCGALTIGLELALLSAEKLFGLRLDGAYSNLFLFMAFVVHPLFFLSGIPPDLEALEREFLYPRGLKFFTQFVLAPLSAVFTGILYIYAIKISLNHRWPNGWVGLPVLLLSLVGILAALLLHPLYRNPEERWAIWFKAYFPRALAPLSILLILAVRERTRAYGMTEERYIGYVAGVWILIWSLVYTFRPATPLRWIPVSLFGLCMVSAFGPWSAVVVSQEDQLKRLKGMLQLYDLPRKDRNDTERGSVTLKHEDYTILHSTILYLAERHGNKVLMPAFSEVLDGKLAESLESYEAWKLTTLIVEALQLVDAGDPKVEGLHYTANPLESINAEGYSKLVIFPTVVNTWSKLNKESRGGITIRLTKETFNVSFSESSPGQPVPLSELFEHLPPSSDKAVPVSKLQTDWEQEGKSLRIVFDSLVLNVDDEGRKSIRNCGFVILEK